MSKKIKLHPSKLVNKASKKVELPFRSIKKDDLTGFEDVVSLLYDDGEDDVSKSKKRQYREGGSEYLVFNFLEKEHDRLIKLDRFLTSKINILADHPQGEQIIEYQEEMLDYLKGSAISKLQAIDSPFNTELKHIWNSIFYKD
jgi:hypothetical protein